MWAMQPISSPMNTNSGQVTVRCAESERSRYGHKFQKQRKIKAIQLMYTLYRSHYYLDKRKYFNQRKNWQSRKVEEIDKTKQLKKKHHHPPKRRKIRGKTNKTDKRKSNNFTFKMAPNTTQLINSCTWNKYCDALAERWSWWQHIHIHTYI